MKPYGLGILGIAVSLLLLTSSVLGASTELHIVLYAEDGFTILNETTIDYRWMEQHLPVRGDGSTHYYLQGPVFVDDPEERWNPEEDANILDKDMGAVKGTDLRDLCELVGGMEPGDTVTLRATDGFSKMFAYENVYEPTARQGAMVIAWYHANQSYVPGYADGMRLVFLADTSTNPWGVHAMGNYDWYESADEEYWYYYYQEGQYYPTTTGLSVKYISEIQIWSSREPKGAIAVTSNPPGALVWLDGVYSGYDTPCSLGELSEGYYSLTVRKNGYLTPEEQDVEVIAGTTVAVSFTLEQAPQSGGGSSSDDVGTVDPIAGTYEEVLAGGQLFPAEELQVEGDFVLLPSASDPFGLRGGEEHLLTFPPQNFTRQPAQVRLYLFLDGSSADPGIRTDPDLIVATGSGAVVPVRIYSEKSDDGPLYATTLVYTLPSWSENGTYPVRSRNHPSWNTTVAGALLIAGYEQQDGRESRVLVCEGADLIGVLPYQELPMTLAEFGNEMSLPEQEKIVILTGTTPETAEGIMSFYVNGGDMPAQKVSSDSPVVIHEISGFSVREPAEIRLHIETRGTPVTNRVAVLMTRSGPPAANITDVVSEAPSTVQPDTTRIPVTTGQEPTGGPAVQAGTARGSDPVGNFLCWLLNLFLMLTGQPSEACHQETTPDVIAPDPTVSVQVSPEPSLLQISSHPEGAMVFLDNQSTDLLTPCEIDLSSGEVRMIRIEKEGYQPFLQQVTWPAQLEAFLVPISPLQEGGNTPAPVPARSRHGGVFISSYPDTAEIRIDGVVVASRSPVLVTPLKEGFHTITAGIPAGTNRYSARQTVRTWIFPDAIVPVEFNLMETVVASSLSITSDSRTGASFTVNGYFPVQRIPNQIEVIGYPAFITVIDGPSYLSFSIPASSRENRQFSIPLENPPVCNLSVTSTPEGAEVFLDGIRTGLLTPTIISNVSTGYHRVSLSLKGKLPITEQIFIAESQCSGGGVSVRYPLAWYPSGSLQLISTPPGAAISFRGLKTGEVTPCTFEDIPIGVWDVTLTLDKVKKGIDATIEPGKTRTYSVVFE